jgi:PAS domain S-box-containing protein
MAESPERVFQQLADAALALCLAGSAGISVWEPGGEKIFRWRATAGDYAQYTGSTLPRSFSPCGEALDRAAVLLMTDPARFYPCLAALHPPIREMLLVPFHVQGRGVGTVWVVLHDEQKDFDAEDVRRLQSLSEFAGAAVLTLGRIDAAQHAETSRREREEHFRALLTATSDVVYGMSADWSEMQPLDGRGLVESSSRPIRGWMEQNLPSFEHARVREAIERAISGQQTFELEHQVIRPDGSLGWTFSRAIPVLDAQGGIAEWLGAASDVTRRKQAEEELRETKRRLELALAASERQKRLYETTLSNTPDLVYVFDLEHRFMFANQALLSLWDKTWEQAIGKTCLELGYEPWHAAMHDAEIEQVRREKQPIRGEVPFGGMDGGGRRVYDYIFVPVFGASGEVEAVAGTTRDITKRQALEQELRETDRKKDDFIAVLAHELRNPLAPISTGLSLLGDATNPELREKTLGVMRRQVDHMVRLIDDLLDVSRITQGKLELRRERVSLSNVIEEAIEGSQLLLNRGQHALRTSLSNEALYLDADHTRIAQVFVNLLNNASKYTPNDGVIELSTARAGDQAVISVRDSGLGIPIDQLEKVFEMFSQVNRALDRSHGGLGIGLSLVRRILAMHGGSVSAFSKGLGHGSTFTVRLPLALAAQATAVAAVQTAQAVAGGARILVVDDNDDAAELLALSLQGAGYEAVAVHDGPSAIVEANGVLPSVIILDIGLPGMSGYEIARHFRSDQRFAQTVLIALTGWGTQEDRRKATAAGFDIHLTKPVSTRDLHEALARASTLRTQAEAKTG